VGTHNLVDLVASRPAACAHIPIADDYLCGVPRRLLKLIAGQLQRDVQVQGTVNFNNCELGSEVQRRVCSYVPQIDTHFAAFTVLDTINFSNDCTMQTHIEDRLGAAGINVKEHLSGGRPKVEMMLTLLGLNHVAKSIVGDGVMRGVSGGEKKRVTTAEMAVTPSMVLCMDEISTGLDAAATFDIIRGLKNACNVLKTTVVISLLQPPPDVLKLFDDVMVMGLGGTLIYHGPLSDVEVNPLSSFTSQLMSPIHSPQITLRDPLFPF
jgi:ABC-type multidrug transport system ATPase subunit